MTLGIVLLIFKLLSEKGLPDRSGLCDTTSLETESILRKITTNVRLFTISSFPDQLVELTHDLPGLSIFENRESDRS